MSTAHAEVIERAGRAPVEALEPADGRYEYPGLPATCDGAEAVVHVEVRISQAAGAYPITSSTTMGGGFNAAMMNGQKNLWGDELMFFEPESEHSAATVCEGFAVAGGRVTNFTSGQGLVLMKEVLYTISGKRLPVVMNIGARADEPGAQRPRRARRRHVGRRLRLGHDLRPQRAGGGGLLPGRPPRRRGHPDPVLQRPGRVPHDAHRRDRPAPGARVHEGVHRRSPAEARQPDGPGEPADVGRRPEPGLLHEGEDRPTPLLPADRAGARERLRRIRPQDRPALRLPRALPLRRRRLHPDRHGMLHGDGQGHGRLPAIGATGSPPAA